MPFVIKKKIIIILIVWGVKQNVAEELFEIVVAMVNMYMCIWKYYWYCLRLNI